MKKHIFTFLFICLLATHLPAQNTFQRVITGKPALGGESLCKADKGQFLHTGYVYKKNDDNIYVCLLDKNGNTVWDEYFDDQINNDARSMAVQTTDGGFMLATQEGSYQPEFSLIKLDANGKLLWSKIYSGFQHFSPSSMVNAYNGNVTIAGDAFDKGFILNVDQTNGNVVWMKTLATYYIAPDDGYESLNSIAKTKDSGYIVCGAAINSLSGDVNAYEMLMAKYTKDGILVWTKIIKPSGRSYLDAAVEALDGTYVFGGSNMVSVTTGEMDNAVLKTDINGNTIWAKQFDNDNNQPNEFDGVYDMIKTQDSLFILTEGLNVVKINNSGSVQWSKKYLYANGSAVSYGIQAILKTNDNGFVLSGRHYISKDIDSMLVIKFDSNGNTCNGTITSSPVVVDMPVATYSFTSVPADATALVQVTNGLYKKINGKGVNTSLCNSVVTVSTVNAETDINAISSNKEFKVILSPNPVVNTVLSVTISYSKTNNSQLTILNMEGKIVLSQKVTLAAGIINKQLNVSALRAGMYILKINDGMQQQTVKFVKQ